MDLTHWHLNAIARKRNLQQPPECCREAAKEAIEAAYRAGREDAAKAVELHIDPDWTPSFHRGMRRAAEIARGNQPRTPEARGDSEHTQDGGE